MSASMKATLTMALIILAVVAFCYGLVWLGDHPQYMKPAAQVFLGLLTGGCIIGGWFGLRSMYRG